MGAAPEVVVQASAAALAEDVAARVIATLAQAQHARDHASVVLTGGSILEQVFTALATSSALDSVDWRRVDVFWGDERFVAGDSPDRNDGPADRLLLDHLDLDPARVHHMPSSDGPDGDDADAAAVRYAETLAAVAKATGVAVARATGVTVAGSSGAVGDIPAFDVGLIGLGPDGHCCSLFPEQPGVHEEKLAIIGVHDSPKPPPTRLSFTFTALAAIEEIWVIAAGEGKADAVAKALGGADRVQVPAAGAQGRQRTLWLLDQAAAAQLPSN